MPKREAAKQQIFDKIRDFVRRNKYATLLVAGIFTSIGTWIGKSVIDYADKKIQIISVIIDDVGNMKKKIDDLSNRLESLHKTLDAEMAKNERHRDERRHSWNHRGR